MVGILTKKRDDRWYVVFTGLDGATEMLPTHPQDIWLDSCDGNEGAQYHFDIVKITDKELREYNYYAKLVKKVDKLDKWENILNSAKQNGINTVEDFLAWLKTHYKAPMKL